MRINQQQAQLWQDSHSNLVFADLCNALYERELKKLAIDSKLPHAFLLKRIASLPYYIKRASQRILSFYSPLDLDSQNASWLYRQPGLCPGPKQNDKDIETFYQSMTTLALVVPIYHGSLVEQHISLDSIDGIDCDNQRIHTNENGWFNLKGEPQGSASVTIATTSQQVQRLLKPTKTTLTCACSGHKWKNHKKTSARALSLREMLLATNINWKNFSKIAVPTT